MATPQNNSVVKAFKILLAFQGRGTRLTLSQVAKLTGLATPTAHRFIHTLVSVGALEVRGNGRYQLGPSSQLLGSCANPYSDPHFILYYHARQLSNRFQETVHIATLSGDLAQYTCKVECSRSVTLASRVGTGLEPYCTGVGKLLLAHVPHEDRMKYLDSGDFIKLTKNTIADPVKIMAELDVIKERGYAIDDEEFEEGLRCLAVPVQVGDQMFALSLSGPTSRIRTSDISGLAKEMTRRAKIINMEAVRSSDWETSVSNDEPPSSLLG